MRLKKDLKLNYNSIHKAFSFQQEAVDAVCDKDYAAVFHEQGLGKTKIALDVTLHWLQKDIVDSVIIVTKKGLVPNWVREIKTHTHIAPKILGNNKQDNFYYFNSPIRIYVTHYELLATEKGRLEIFLQTRRVAIILDESQKIKNPTAKITKAAFNLSSGFRKKLILTGTPIANRPYDIWSQFFFLDQGNALGKDFEDFKRRLELPKSVDTQSKEITDFEHNLSELYSLIQPYSVRETKDGGRIDLPDKIISNVECDWETLQWSIYQSIQKDLSLHVIKDGKMVEDNVEPVLKRLLRLVQAASNPNLLDENYNETPGKYFALEELVDQIMYQDEKVIIWTSFTQNADWLSMKLKKYGPRKIHGKMNHEDRQKSIDLFLTDDETKILIATPGAAKEGFTLTVANHVIFYDRGFSLDDYLQAQDRIHRISQKKTCYVHNLILKGSIDEWVDMLLFAKSHAAKLGTRDLSPKQFQDSMDYSFNEVIAQILKQNKTQEGKI